MLSILADALLIATGSRPPMRHQTRDTAWNDRFLPRQLQDLDHAGRGVNPHRDLKW